VIDNVDPWFFWWLLSLAAAVCVTLKFAHGIKPYDEGPRPKPHPRFSDHIVCSARNCHNPADGIHETRRIPMCDRCAQEINASDGNR